MKTKRWLCLLFCQAAVSAMAANDNSPYDPLQLGDPNASPAPVELVVTDQHRSREIPLRVYLPAGTEPAAVVLFSHGLGGSRQGCSYLGGHWAGRGYAAIFVQHPGSDTSVWQDVPAAERMQAMNQAANVQNYLLRVKDIPAVLDQLELWNAASDHVLYQRLDMNRVGMSGHSFGAVTTQAVSGQADFMGRQSFTDPRIRAAIAFSPSTPKGRNPERVFGKVSIPWMLMTGTRDLSVIGDADLASRLAVFEALPPGDKYELVLFEAEHAAFTARGLPGDTLPRNPNHHRVICALSTAFWDAYLNQNAEARQWLTADGPRTVLEDQDRWQTK